MDRTPHNKPTSIPWLGDVPAHWEVKRIKAVVVRSENGAWGEDEKGDEQDVYCYRAADFDTARMVVAPDKLVKRHIEPEVFRKKAVRPHHLLIEKSGGGENVPVGRVVHSLLNEPAVFSNFLGLIEVDALQADSNFMRYQFWHLYDRRVPWRSIKQTTGLQNLDTSSYFNERLAFPPLPEQRAIAAFLDERTARIDGLVARKRRLAQLLKEKRQALITCAVTRGLDANVKLKPSGVPWLGEVPEGWEVKPLRYLGTFQNGISAGAEYFGSGEPFVNYKDVYSNPELPSNVEGLANSTFEDQSRYSVRCGDVLFTRTSETVEEIGISSACLHTIEMATFSGFLIRFRPLPGFLAPAFAKHYFRSDVHRSFFVKEMNLVTRASLGQELLKKLPVLLPPLQEQQAIAGWIDKSCSRLDSLVSKVEVAIERLQEYRTALISAAVTGKVKVA
jgi:type I restriction enzyme S subunit